ncbi:hypothetical protein CASFOL_015956 [Castilleja foliolosa]|uniref:Ribosome-associated protein n=1 Tax=Castilleja foliolosa TaxID=1961234 RepID=A0ABD3DFK6_9LAMI
MAHVLRPLIQWPRWRCPHSTVSRLIRLPSSPPRATADPPFLAFLSNSHRQAHFRSRALKLRDVDSLSEASGSDDESSDGGGMRKSRNAKKRVARRAVRWGMELASFSPPQIKRIVRVADLEQEVFDALMIVKRLGRDVREGKRRQYNYIGRLLREVEPELMDDLIKATKEGDQSKFQSLSGTEILDVDDNEEEEEEETAEEDEEDPMNNNAVTRWYDGLIDKDISITNEIYSLREVEFDRQKLRQLVRKVHSAHEASLEENGKTEVAATNARKALARFLQGLAKQLPAY